MQYKALEASRHAGMTVCVLFASGRTLAYLVMCAFVPLGEDLFHGISAWRKHSVERITAAAKPPGISIDPTFACEQIVLHIMADFPGSVRALLIVPPCFML